MSDAGPDAPEIESLGRRSYACGVACIVFVAVVWTFATVLKQIIFSDLNFDEPLILTYVPHLEPGCGRLKVVESCCWS